MIQWLRAIERLRAGARRVVIVTVASVKGSTPREAGAKMIVEADAIHGTIGGGHLEFQAIDIARALLVDNGEGGADGAELRRFPLGATLGQCCGGVANLLFEPVDTASAAAAAWIEALLGTQRRGERCIVVTPLRGRAGGKLVVTAAAAADGDDDEGPTTARVRALARDMLNGPVSAAGVAVRVVDCAAPGEAPAPLLFEPVLPPSLRVVLFGAGHVGRALVATLAALDCELTWVDGRDAAFPAAVPPHFDLEATDEPLAIVDRALADTCFLVMTHSHALDFEITERILRRGDFRYLGLIGSMTKRRRFEQRLAARGLDEAALQRIRCPIGIDGIESKEPAAIAIAAAAELLRLRECLAARAGEPLAARRA